MTINSDYITCDFCGKGLDPKALGVYQRVVGWVQNRKGGGANQVTLSSEATGWAHNECLEDEKIRVKRGWNPGNDPALF